MKKVSIINLGCKVNQYESDHIAGILSSNGFLVDFGLVEADIYFINTCAVTNEGERKSRNMVTKVLKLNPDADVYVAGCASENNSEHFTKFSNVKYVIGTQDKESIAYKICRDNGITPKLANINLSNRTRGVLKCQDGCNNFCTYCLIPYVRGREKSVPLDNLKTEFDSMIADGVKEVVLTGINLSGYGKDFENGTSLVDIAKMISSENNKLGADVRYRFSSLEVNIVTQQFLEYLKSDKYFCPHFHLSMQSGCNKTLRDMNRHYTKEDFLSKVELIRKYFPLAAITTDVIVGFPTETEENFKETYETCKKANFFEMHVFPYSKRDGTVAAKFKNVASMVKDRVWELKKLSATNQTKFIEKNIAEDSIKQVIIETTDGEYYTAHTNNYIKCYIKREKGVELKNNQIISVQLKENYLDGAKAEICG